MFQGSLSGKAFPTPDLLQPLLIFLQDQFLSSLAVIVFKYPRTMTWALFLEPFKRELLPSSHSTKIPNTPRQLTLSADFSFLTRATLCHHHAFSKAFPITILWWLAKPPGMLSINCSIWLKIKYIRPGAVA